IEQSNRAMSQMDQVTQQAAANSEETSSASEELASQAQELASLVGRFELGSSARGGVGAGRRGSHKGGGLGRREPRRGAAHTNGYALSASYAAVPANGNGHAPSRSLAEALIPMDDDPDLRDF